MKTNIINIMTATVVAANTPSVGRIRPLNLIRDLPAVADLIELCFSNTLDPEGRSYIDQMRRNGYDSSFLNWAPRVIETVSLPLSGFVWEHNGRLVGNVSLIPFTRRGKRIFLIANVATHPDFRRQGIARQLTLAAMQRAREKRAEAIWLHVRDDNPGAIQLYNQLGFVERSLRRTWQASQTIPMGNLGTLQIAPRPARDWPDQSKWLTRVYPPEMDWYYPQSWDIFKPGIFPWFYRLMADIKTRQWSAYQDGKLLGVLANQSSSGRVNHLWLALPDQPDLDAVTYLLIYGRRSLSPRHGLVIEYPAGLMDGAFLAAGLVTQRTLSWMEAPGAQLFKG